MGVGSKDAVPAGFPKKNSGPALKALYTDGHRGRSPAIVVSHNGPKNQNTRGVPGGLPLALLFPLSLCKERGRRPDPFLQGVLEFVRAYKTLS